MVQIPRKRIASKQKSLSKTRRRLQVFKYLLVENTEEFFKNITLHGLKYIVDRELHPLERLYFGVAFIITVGWSFFFTIQVMSTWGRTPVIFGSNPEPTYITDHPFPAVTICNLNVAVKNKAEKYSIFSTEYAMLQMLCRRDVNVSIATTITDWSHVHDFVSDISQPCQSMLLYCEFASVKYNCSDLFVPTVTDEGLCCVFNSLHPIFLLNRRGLKYANATNEAKVKHVSWTVENGYPDELPENFSPFKTAGVGETMGLRIILDAQLHDYYCSTTYSVGFKMLLHSPTDKPSVREIGLYLAPGFETKVRITPEKFDSEAKLHTVRSSMRQCVFEQEQKLMFYQHYSQRNCELECFTNMTLQICGCITYYNIKPYENVQVCSLYDSQCVDRVTRLSAGCSRRCLPGCFDIAFYPDFFPSPLRQSKFESVYPMLNGMNSSYAEENLAVVNMYFKESSYRSSKQTEFISGTDILSSIGGLMSLFIGFSFISIAEVFFFTVMRPLRRTCSLNKLTPGERLTLTSNAPREIERATMASQRKRYKRELGFNNLKNLEDISEVDISKLYMPAEFTKKKQSLDDIVEKWYTHKSTFK